MVKTRKQLAAKAARKSTGGARKKPVKKMDKKPISPAVDLDGIRCSNTLVMLQIYSFLPLEDRFNLRFVDRKFWLDPEEALFCKPSVGVYGYSNWNIHQAFRLVQEFLDDQGTPAYLHRELEEYDEIVMYEYGWDDLLEQHFGEGWGWNNFDWAFQRLLGLYDQAAGLYNSHNIEGEEESGRGKFLQGMILSVNKARQKIQGKLAKVSQDIGALTANGTMDAPYNALFDVMTKNKIWTVPFLKAEYPWSYEQDDEYIYRYCRRNEQGRLEETFLEHLRPGRKLQYRNDGNIIEGILKPCETCKKVRGDVKKEHCGQEVGHSCCSINYVSVCSDCTTKLECTSCNELRCNSPSQCCYNFVPCCIPGCISKMCSPKMFDLHGPRSYQEWDGQSCVYALPRPTDMEENEYMGRVYFRDLEPFYCLDHKPNEAIPVPPFSVAIMGVMNERWERHLAQGL